MKPNNPIRTMAALLAVVAALYLGCNSMYVQTGDDADFLSSGQTSSFFTAIQIDPKAEDSAGPQFIDVGDFNNDGMMDIVSAWNESQPVQVHIQQRTTDDKIVFATIPIGGTTPISRVSGLEVADMDQDGFDDIVVLVKDTGLIAQCDQSREDCDVTDNGGFIVEAVSGLIVIFFNTQDVLSEPWEGVVLGQSLLAGTDEGELPEEGGYSSLDVGDIDGINGPDIIVALNSPEGDPLLSEVPPNTIDFYPNPGAGTARREEAWSRFILHGDIPPVSACKIADVDGDGDNDIIATYPIAKNGNLRWLANPLSLGDEGNVYDFWPPHAPLGQIATNANVIEIGDVDGDGHDDVLVRSTEGRIVQWFKKPEFPSQTFIRNPWQVFTMAQFSQRMPQAIALGDLTGDGRLDAAIAAQGAVAWFTPISTERQFDHWIEQLIVDDSPPEDDTSLSSMTDPGAFATGPIAGGGADGEDGTLINALLIADLDGDGWNDIIATLDRGELSGLAYDALVWFRNNSGDP